MSNFHRDQVVQAILKYLEDNPSAHDTASGIAQWWVRGDKKTIVKALELLVVADALEVNDGIYRLRRK
jgi:hypothetical protein